MGNKHISTSAHQQIINLGIVIDSFIVHSFIVHSS